MDNYRIVIKPMGLIALAVLIPAAIIGVAASQFRGRRAAQTNEQKPIGASVSQGTGPVATPGATATPAKPGTNALSQPSPQIANRPLTIRCVVEPIAERSNGVLMAQGGDQRGYVLHLKDGRPVFGVRENAKLFQIIAAKMPKGRFSLEAHLATDGAMTLMVNGIIAARGQATGLIEAQPKDELSIGEDFASAVGDYTPPHPFLGKIENVRIETGAAPD